MADGVWSKYETGRHEPNEATMMKIAAALNLPAEEMLAYSRNIPPDTEHYLQGMPRALRILDALAARKVSERGVEALLRRIESGKVE